MKIIEYTDKYISSVKDIASRLHPKWFDVNALHNIPNDIKFNKTFLASKNDEVVGFLVCSSKESNVTITWIGVDPDSHNQGIGKALVEYLIEYAKSCGIKTINAGTVVEQTPADGSYDLTIGFYKHMGFSIISQSELKDQDGFRYRMGVFTKNIS